MTDEQLTAYLATRDAQRAEAVERFLAKLTPREQRLVREAAVMGWVQGLQRNRGDADAVLPDSAMLATVVEAMFANADLYPVTSHVAAQPAAVVVEMTREDARELGLILDMDRQRMDKGDDRPVPQPRWGANVRVSKAVAAALDATREG